MKIQLNEEKLAKLTKLIQDAERFDSKDQTDENKKTRKGVIKIEEKYNTQFIDVLNKQLEAKKVDVEELMKTYDPKYDIESMNILRLLQFSSTIFPIPKEFFKEREEFIYQQSSSLQLYAIHILLNKNEGLNECMGALFERLKF